MKRFMCLHNLNFSTFLLFVVTFSGTVFTVSAELHQNIAAQARLYLGGNKWATKPTSYLNPIYVPFTNALMVTFTLNTDP